LLLLDDVEQGQELAEAMEPGRDPDFVVDSAPGSGGMYATPFLSKLLERVVQARLQAHFDGKSLLPRWQSAYRRFHSTETAVTKVLNDLLLAADRGQMSALCLLDLSAAFDTGSRATAAMTRASVWPAW